MNKKSIFKIVLLVVLLVWISLFIGFSAFKITNPSILCWDGLDIDEEKLMQDCKVTPEEYEQQIEINESFCPEGDESFRLIGGCEPEYSLTIQELILPFIIWIVILVIIIIIYFKTKK